ncbi:MAG: hypothetical protein M1819_001240 [Sarea resinae]|nr:MAG: hypothetical protein M1819_001240 [Sarea resinae]
MADITGGSGDKAAPPSGASTGIKPTGSAPVRKTSPTATTDKPSAAESRYAAQQEKTRALFEKYGLTYTPQEWALPNRKAAERVEKPIRMRVHRQCHRCQTTFGREKTCSNCQHERCKKCPRFPAKKSKEAKERGAAASGLTGTPGTEKARGKAIKRSHGDLLTIPSKTGGQDLVRKPIRQRVHRTCHKCQAEFTPGEKDCVKCGHVRCKKCPRDPAKLKKYPDGYPGDAEPTPEVRQTAERTYRKIRTRVRWYCHSCSSMFAESSKTCSSCSHERCDDCNRVPPKKAKPEPDPEVLKSLQEKLANISLNITVA